jgi:HlyD family secretion protein
MSQPESPRLPRPARQAITSPAPTKLRAISSWRGIALAGYSLIGVTFGVGGVWAAVAKLDKAVSAPGYVETESNRKTVQHLEGGIIRNILVKEGDPVVSGQVLFRLQRVQAEANSDTVRSQLDFQSALEARLIAERDNAQNIEWPKLLLDRADDPVASKVMDDQKHQFNQRRASREGQTNVLNSRIEELQKEIEGIAAQKSSTQEQVGYINKELVGLRELGAKQLIPTTRVYAMERERARLEGVLGQADADTAKAQSTIGEMKLQISAIEQKFQEEVAANLLDARQKLSDLGERNVVANDVLSRIEIKAPNAGTAQNLKVYSVGQVVRPGEALVDIVPDNEPLVVDAQFSITDVDAIYAGSTAEIRFPAFHSRTIPVMTGMLQSVSHDRLIDDLTHQPYFRGVVALNRADIPEEYRSRLRPGMPAEVIVSSGSRTVLNYLVSPLTSSLRKTFRESND